ncbi:MAG: phosphoglucosamine mutase, partial [Candidatus Ratteibacteria bacterium]
MDEFFSCLFNFIDVSAIRKKRFRVVVDPVQGAGALYSKNFLEMLGCETKIINESPLGKFSHHPEPVPSHLRKLSYIVRDENADIGFAQDPDCDRLVLVEKGGKFISEEQGLAISIQWMLQRKKGPVVVNIATTKLIDDICAKFQTQLFRTKVGEVFVVEEMKKVGAVAGGEGNGGIILPEFHYGRDSYIGMGLILEMMAKTSLSLTEILGKLPRYKFIKRKIEFPKERIEWLYKSIEKEFSEGRISYLDGLRIDFDDVWFGIRSSGTEPVIRIFVEGKKQSRIYQIINLIERYITSFGKNS